MGDNSGTSGTSTIKTTSTEIKESKEVINLVPEEVKRERGWGSLD